MSSSFLKIKYSYGHLKKQQGVILMIMLILLVVGSAAFLVNAMINSSAQIDRNKNTSLALSQAKEVLIAYAASNSTPGQLPCPENTAKIGTATEGDALSSCTLPAIGRLPWRTLGIDNLRDGNGDQLWYVLSPGFHGSSINSDTPAQLTIDGVSNSAVAIIFSAGTPINSQTRPVPTAATPPVVTQYLELSNNDGDNTFVSSGPAATFNDKLLLVKHDDLFRVVEKRVAGEVKLCLDQYALANSGRYPWASTLSSYADNTGQFFGRIPDAPFTATQGSSGGSMIMGSMTGGMDYTWVGSCSIVSGSGWWLNWKDLVFYGLSAAYKPYNPPSTPALCTTSTCLVVGPASTVADKRYVVLVAGKALASQATRIISNPSTYLEGGNESANQTGNYTFIQGNQTSIFNDTVVFQ